MAQLRRGVGPTSPVAVGPTSPVAVGPTSPVAVGPTSPVTRADSPVKFACLGLFIFAARTKIVELAKDSIEVYSDT